MSERDEATSGARQGLHFYAGCAREAWRRSWDAGNAWPPVLVLLALFGGARLAGIDLSFPGDGELAVAIGAGLFVALAWLAVFLVQFVAAPPRAYARLAERQARPMPQLPAPRSPEAPVALLPAAAPIAMAPAVTVVPPRSALPPLDIRLHDQRAETDAVDAAGERLPSSRAYVARIVNRGDAPLRRCQLFFGSATHIQVVSAPFDLAPSAHRDLPVLRVIDDGDEPHALLYFLDSETWGVAPGQAAWLPEPGRFKVKVLSADASAALDVRLACSTGTPLAWTLVEAGAESTPKPGRKRRAWTTDVVAEPNSGD